MSGRVAARAQAAARTITGPGKRDVIHGGRGADRPGAPEPVRSGLEPALQRLELRL